MSARRRTIPSGRCRCPRCDVPPRAVCSALAGFVADNRNDARTGSGLESDYGDGLWPDRGLDFSGSAWVMLSDYATRSNNP